MLSKQPESNVYKGWPMNKDEWFFYCARLQNDETQNTNTSLQKKKRKNNLLECMHVSIINIVGLLSKQKKTNNEK